MPLPVGPREQKGGGFAAPPDGRLCRVYGRTTLGRRTLCPRTHGGIRTHHCQVPKTCASAVGLREQEMGRLPLLAAVRRIQGPLTGHHSAVRSMPAEPPCPLNSRPSTEAQSSRGLVLPVGFEPTPYGF